MTRSLLDPSACKFMAPKLTPEERQQKAAYQAGFDAGIYGRKCMPPKKWASHADAWREGWDAGHPETEGFEDE